MKNGKSISEYGTALSNLPFMLLKFPRRKERGREKMLEEIMAKTFPNLIKTIHILGLP